jgi:hypothetical protein
MKMQTIIRMQMLVGLGAALLLASPVRAQQEVDPTSFDINPGTPKVEQSVALQKGLPQATATLADNALSSQNSDRDNLIATALWSQKATQEETDLARMTMMDALLVIILVSGIGSIVLYAKVATRRQRHLEPILRDGPYGSASGATTH